MNNNYFLPCLGIRHKVSDWGAFLQQTLRGACGPPVSLLEGVSISASSTSMENFCKESKTDSSFTARRKRIIVIRVISIGIGTFKCGIRSCTLVACLVPEKLLNQLPVKVLLIDISMFQTN